MRTSTYLTGPFTPIGAHRHPLDRGGWLTFTTRHSTGASALVVIPAAAPARGPVAEIRMPVRVPLGQHGNWITY